MADLVHLFLSPHLDDAVLSCGGYIHRLAAGGESVIIATLVTADLPKGQPPTWVARRNHRTWRLGDAPFRARCQEDIAAAARLGARTLHLGLLDAMYRRDAQGQPYYTRRTTGIPVDPRDWQEAVPVFRRALEQMFASLGSAPVRVYCPLGAGEHVDHQIVRHVVEGLVESGGMVYYEDYPYANAPGAIQKRLDGPAETWNASTIALTPAEIEARIDASACYTSQMPGLFPTTLDRAVEIIRARLPVLGEHFILPLDARALHARMTREFTGYIGAVGGERYWKRAHAGN